MLRNAASKLYTTIFTATIPIVPYSISTGMSGKIVAVLIYFKFTYNF